MRLQEIESVQEVSVISSWISDIEWENGSVVMTLNNGRQYRVHGISKGLFKKWLSAHSKGQFWHQNIRGLKQVTRI